MKEKTAKFLADYIGLFIELVATGNKPLIIISVPLDTEIDREDPLTNIKSLTIVHPELANLNQAMEVLFEIVDGKFTNKETLQ